MPVRESLYPVLTAELAALLKGLSLQQAAMLEELRIYRGQAAELVISGARKKTALCVGERQMDELLAALSGHALYRFERQMAEGYIPLPDGHRAGVCGTMTRQEDGSWKMGAVSSVCLRIARRIRDASMAVRSQLFDENGRARRVLLLGAPGCGKTTVLRDAAMYMAAQTHVAVADEREELFADHAWMEEGIALDVMSGVDKARACEMLIRSMAPQVIVCDELGREADVQAMLDAVRCGVGVLSSAHADGLDDLMKRPLLRRLYDACAFERYVHLGRHGSVIAVWDEMGKRIDEGGAHDGELGCCGDGDDRRELRGFSAFSRGTAAREMDWRDAALHSSPVRCHPI